MKWQVKLVKNAAIGLLPIPIQDRIRRMKRRMIGYKVFIDEQTLRQGLQQVQMLREAGHDPRGADYLEIGTGWAPIIPLVFALSGCRSLTLVDSQRLMDASSFAETCRRLVAYKEELAEVVGGGPDRVEAILAGIAALPFEWALRSINCTYLAPYDITNHSLPENSVDIVTSRAVLEHVPPQVIKGMFREVRTLMRAEGAMCHIIDNSDHWEHHDKSITRLNFLKYSEQTFRFLSSLNPLDFQNRLRHSQYREMLEEAGYRVVVDPSRPDEKSLAELPKVKLHRSFERFPKEDLAILTSYLVATKR